MTIKLNPTQKEAVKHEKGPLLIIAGAGTGKTTVITERIKWLITKKNILPSQILALTFTNKAALEMEERVDLALPLGYSNMWISTFHSFGDRVLRDEAVHIGLDPNFKLLSQAESLLFLRKNLFKLKLNYFRPATNPTKFLDALLTHFARLADEYISPQEYLNFAQKQKDKADTKEEKLEAKKSLELANCFAQCQILKEKNGFMDFSDLISNTLALFNKRPNILRNYQEKFKHVLVDEFQDTNIAQNELISLLTLKKGNITVVADDDQCLPANTLIETPQGRKNIKNIKTGDMVITGVGKGYVSAKKVTKKFTSKKTADFLSVTMECGKNLTLTANHLVFCYTPRFYTNKKWYYIYLMENKDLGWRLGVTHDLVQRLKLERSADRIIAIKACKTNQEAHYWESYYSLKYKIPTVCFKERGNLIAGEWLKKLYSAIDSKKGAINLANDLQIELSRHHYCLDAVNRGSKKRTKVNLYLCLRKHRIKKHLKNNILINPKIVHQVGITTSNKRVINIVRSLGLDMTKGKKNTKAFRKQFSSFIEAGKFARYLADSTKAILDIKTAIATKNGISKQARVMPASNLVEGIYLPILKNNNIVYDEIVAISRKRKTQTVYDLEIEDSHNFIANQIVVHNSIYKWRGAAISNVLQFKKNFPKTKIITLNQNYRSTQEILDRAYQLIQNNNPDRLEVKERINKKLKAVRPIKGKPIELIFTPRAEQEAEEVAIRIKKLVSRKYEPRDVAILVRANSQAESFTRALSRNNIPYQFLGPGQLFRQPEIKNLISYLKILTNPEDNVALFRLSNLPVFKIWARDLAFSNSFAKKNNLSLFEAFEKISQKKKKNEELNLPSFAKVSQNGIKKLVKIVYRHWKLVSKESGGQLLYYFLEQTKLLEQYLKPETENQQLAALNIAKFFDKIKSFEAQNKETLAGDLLDWITLRMEMGESPQASEIDWTNYNAVNIITIHSAKGLEFPIVFLVNLVNRRFPTDKRREAIPIPQPLIKEILPKGDYHLQEERRLFYVGLTRAKDQVFLTAAKVYPERKLEKKLSIFVNETLGDQKERSILNEKSSSLAEWEKEKQVEKAPVLNPPVSFLSYSQIDAFDICPRQYQYKYALRITTPPSATQTFGSIVHQTLKAFCQKQIAANHKLKQEELLKLLSQSWISRGFKSKLEEKKAKQNAAKMLKNYYQKGFNYQNVDQVMALEQSFNFKITPGLKIGGIIDRVDNLKNNQIEIIDYKTGARIPKQKDVDGNDQLTLYALAASSLKDLSFYRPLNKIILSLYFLDQGKKLSSKRTPSQIGKFKEKIINLAKELEKTNFPSQPNTPFPCDFCEYKLLCDAWH
ncbi:MAG: UvrD-helicase domain-containing protein [Candidatus Shapirobacteria bacterium]